MDKFPYSVARGMRSNGAMTTCVPVQFDHGVWETAVFFEIGGKQCKQDRRALRKNRSPVPISVEADLINHANASVVMLRFEVFTAKEHPLIGEVLLTPGLGDIQFDALKYFSEQRHIRWYFGDSAYNVIHSQQTALHDHERKSYEALLNEAVLHDALVRLTGKYNASEAINEVVSHYDFRR